MGIIFQTTFDVPEWTQGGGLDPDPTGDNINHSGDWVTSNGSGTQIIAAANHAAGGGGRGMRQYRGDGSNNVGGGLALMGDTPPGLTEMWVRFYMKYQSGFAWSGDDPNYTKENFWTGANSFLFGIQGGHSWGILYSGNYYTSSRTWNATMGGTVGDGLWHCYEYHVKQNGVNGQVEIWVDDVQYLNATGDLGSTTWDTALFGENQAIVTGAGGTDYFTDYDDIAISDSARIGPLSGGSPPAFSSPLMAQAYF